MRSLSVKLTLAFLLVGLTGAVLVAFFIRRSTQREFDRLVVDQNQQILVNILTNHYQATGGWDGVEAVFRPGGASPLAERHDAPWDSRRSLFMITDADGRVVYGGNPRYIGQELSSANLKKGVPLKTGETTIGWLIFAPAVDHWEAGTPEGNFLVSVNRATYVSALVATGIALILGSVLAYTMTRSLRELTAATKDLARGKLGSQVKVRSRDELGDLAASFNQMSSELEHSNQLRRKMTADIAHDLRTPLSVMMGYTEALSDGKLEANPETFRVMHTEALHLSHLVDDLKTLSLADARELPLNSQKVSPGDLLSRAESAYRVQAERNEISIQVEITPDLPAIEVDVERMAQVLGNLMSNALRYTPAGGEIRLKAEQSQGKVTLSITDTGAGIAAEDLPYVFERSYRGDKARQQGEGETGLGLAIAKSLVEAQGGSVSVESQLGTGTRFTLTF
jgi:signal transduction histidine kinase